MGYIARFPINVIILQLVTILSRLAPKFQGRTRISYLRASARIRKGRSGESWIVINGEAGRAGSTCRRIEERLAWNLPDELFSQLSWSTGSGIQETRKSRSSPLISVRRTLHFGTLPSLPPSFSPSVFLSTLFLPSSPRSRWHHPFGAPSHPHPRRDGDTFRRGTVPPTRGSRKFLSRSRNYNYPLGYARYAASRCAREADLQHSCPRRDVCLLFLWSDQWI